MRLCITAIGTGFDALVDPTFGRARHFVLVDSETLAVEALANEPGAHGAGVQAAQRMVDHGVKAVLTGNVGPNAFQGLNAAGIQVYTGVTGTIREAVDAYRSGRLTRAAAPTLAGHGGARA